MRPLCLEMQAFGPFAARQVIDFRELGARTFFLIHGPTGSGKTTLLDGLCFALFGDTSGGEREARDMRSHHAAADTLTEVSFMFALGERQYVVRRIPEQRRPALRGRREVTQQKEAELLSVPEGRVIAARWERVTDAIESLLGLSSAQFRQIILLPQGKFFQFLKSSSGDREKILQTLFGTEFYKALELRLKEAAQEAERSAQAALERRRTLLDQAEVPDEAGLQGAIAERRQQWQEAQEAQRQAQLRWVQAQAAWQTVQATLARLAERDAAHRALVDLQGQEAHWQARVQERDRARAAWRVQAQVQALHELRQQADRASEQVQALQGVHQQCCEQARATRSAREQAHARRAELDSFTAQEVALTGLLERVGALAQARVDAEAAQARQALALRALEQSQSALPSMTREVVALGEALQGLREQASQRESLKARHETLSQRVLQQTQWQQAQHAQADLDDRAHRHDAALEAAVRSLAEHRATYRRVQKDWMLGQAARLAADLQAGEPCPVCGGTEHPLPQLSAHAPVTDAALQASESEVQRAEAELQAAQSRALTARTAADAARASLAALTAALGVMDPIGILNAQLKDVAAALARAEAASDSLSVQQAALSTAERRRAQIEVQVQSEGQAYQQALNQAQITQAVLQERESGVPAQWSSLPAVQGEIDRLRTQRSALESLIERADQADVAAQSGLTQADSNLQAAQGVASQVRARVDSLVDALTGRLRAEGFDDIGAQQQALMPEAGLTGLEASIEHHRQRMAAAVDRWQRASDSAQSLSAPDPVAEQAAYDAAQVAQHQAIERTSQTQSTLQALERIARMLTDLGQEAQRREQHLALARGLSDLAGGSNRQRLSLQRYMLATLFEEVLAATHPRLALMSRGRYELRRRSDVIDQRSAAGLDLEVFDHHTGALRPISTLSGGESFMASLALALGLSDVVQAHAGGIRLDAIFVDEGFGTLDADTLDVAIRALMDLQQTGRLVGIISHVSELREWIDARLEVTLGARGSAAAFSL